MGILQRGSHADSVALYTYTHEIVVGSENAMHKR